MRGFVRLLQGEEEYLSGHTVEAAAKLAIALGTRAADFVKKSGLSLHDAGINMPARKLSAEQGTFLFRYAHKAADAIRVVGAWETITGELAVNPMEKGGLEAALEALKALHYEGTRHHEFARVAAECGVSQWDFADTQDRWLAGLDLLTFQGVPSPGTLNEGELRLVQLAKNDPRGLFLGVFTGCCQHPHGAGAASAWHGHESGDGAFWVVERYGRIIAQAWVWKHEDNLVLDSVEATASIGDETRIRAKALFQAAANAVLGKLGVNRVYAGTGYGGIHWNELEEISRPFHCPAGYSDSSSVWLIAGQAPEVK